MYNPSEKFNGYNSFASGFGNVENQEIYTVATLLDSRYKGYFFRNEETYADTKRAIIEKLVDALSEGGSNQATEARSAVAAPTNAPHFRMLMSAIIAKNQRDSQVSEVDAIRVAAQTALEHYLALPLSDPYDKTIPRNRRNLSNDADSKATQKACLTALNNCK